MTLPISQSSQADSLAQAFALFSSGRPDEALLLLAAIPSDSRLHPHALHLGGTVHAVQGRILEAIDMFEHALPWFANNGELHANLARAYFASGRYIDALRMLDKAADLGKADAATFSDRAVVLEKLGKHTLALADFDTALQLDPGFCAAWLSKANLLHEMQRYGEALACYDRVVGMQPDNALARSGRASTLDKLGRMVEGLAEHQHALALDSHHAALWSGQGVCFVLLDRLEEGLRCFDQALAIDPAHPQAMINRASLLAELYRFPESLSQFDAALQKTKGDGRTRAEGLFFRGMARLAMGDPSGWADYEYRFHKENAVDQHNVLAPQWSGTEPLAGKRILLWGEQGYGDVIQFCRYTVSLKELGASVILEVPAPLLTLCASLPADAVYCQRAELPPLDFHIPMMSMPLALQSQPQLIGIPCAQGYLKTQTGMIEKWRHFMPATRKLKIGVACSGALHHARNVRWSIPLEKLCPLLDVAELVVLQPELTAADSATASTTPGITHASLDHSDFADVAGLIANLDLVISVDTSLAHLAGAMGVPVWILLPWNAEWRWMTTRTDTPWYDSARLFRQPPKSDWDAVIRDVLLALNK